MSDYGECLTGEDEAHLSTSFPFLEDVKWTFIIEMGSKNWRRLESHALKHAHTHVICIIVVDVWGSETFLNV